MNPSRKEIETILKALRLTAPHPKWVINSLESYAINPGSASQALLSSVIQYIHQTGIASALIDGDLTFGISTDDDLLAGPLMGHQLLGSTAVRPYHFPVNRWQKPHTICLGASGSGKTSFAKRVIVAYARDQSVRFWIFDSLKEYREVFHSCPNLIVFPFFNIRFNPLEPTEGVEIEEHIQHFVEIYKFSFGVLIGSASFLHSTLLDFVPLYLKQTGLYPTLKDYVHYLQRIKPKAEFRQYRHLNVMRLMSICQALDPVIGVHHGILNDVLKSGKSIVWETDPIRSSEIRSFFCELLITSAYLYRRNAC